MNEELRKCSNFVKIAGRVVDTFTFNHKIFGEKYFKTYIEVKRTSGNFDILPVIVSEKLIDTSIKTGGYVIISGEFRSYNTADNKLDLFIFAKEIYVSLKEIYQNEIELKGYVCKKPLYRGTPLGKKITDVFLAANRACGKTDYIPTIFWGKNAYITSRLKTGNLIKGIGRIQSRLYTKQVDGQNLEKTAYEVSFFTIESVE